MSHRPTLRHAVPFFLVAALASACAAPTGPAPAPAVPAPPTVTPTPAPGIDPPPVAEPQPTAARLELRPAQAEVALGSRTTVALTNVDDHAFRFHYPGGSNGCAAFRWHVSLVDARGQAYVDEHRDPRQPCTAVMIPPGWVTIDPGTSTPIAVDTGREWYEVGGVTALDRGPAHHALQPGAYDVVVWTPTGEVRGKIRILPRV